MLDDGLLTGSISSLVRVRHWIKKVPVMACPYQGVVIVDDHCLSDKR